MLAACGSARPAAKSNSNGAGLPGAPASAEEWARYEAGLVELASYYKISDPPPVVVRAWLKPEERSAYVDPCVRESGFQQEGRLWVGITPDQQSAFNLAQFKCSAAYPAMPKYSGSLNKTNKSNAYDWTVEKVIPCLESHGYTIRDIPSRAVFIASFDTQPFYPFSQLPVLSNDEMEALETECRQWPPSEYLYGK